MSDIQLLKDQVNALEAKGKELRKAEKVFLKAQGLAEEIEKARVEIADNEADTEVLKENLYELQDKKTRAIRPALLAIQKKMESVLTSGSGIIHIEDDGSLIIGWLKEYLRPYAGLSGGERVLFDAALSFALLGNSENKVLILEAAELDETNLQSALEHLQKVNPDAQIILNTCSPVTPGGKSKGWHVVEL